MCPVGYALVQSVLAWGFTKGSWVGIDMCLNEKKQEGIVVRQDTNEVVNVYRVTISDKEFWVIDEKEDNND